MGLVSYNLSRLFQRESLSDYLPWISEIEPGIFYLQDGSLGFVFELAPLPVATEETAKVLEELYNNQEVPEGTVFEFFLFASPDISQTIERWASLRTRGGIFEEITLLRKKFYKEAAKTGFFSDYDFKPRDFRLFFSLNTPAPGETINPLRALWMNISKKAKSIKEVSIEEIKKLMEIVRNSLNSAYIPNITLDANSFIDILVPIFNSFEAQTFLFDPKLMIKKQIIHRDTSIIREDSKILINERPCRVFTIANYPDAFHISNVGELVGDKFEISKQITCPFSIVVKVIKEDFMKMKRNVNVKGGISQKQSIGALSYFFPSVSMRAEEYRYAMSALEKNKMLAKGFYSIILYAKDNSELERATRQLETIYIHKGFHLHMEKEMNLANFLVSFPLSYRPILCGGESLNGDRRNFLRREYTAFTNNFASLSPVEAEWKGTRTPTLIFFGRKGQIMKIDLFDSQTGYNGLIVGETGGGKSFLANELIMNYLSQGAKVWVVEIGRSYERTCQFAGGKTIVFREDSSWDLNPFSSVVEVDSEEFSFMVPIFSKMASPSREPTDIEKSFIEQAVRGAWETNGPNASVEDVRKVLETFNDTRAKDLASMLYPWSPKGRFGRFFAGNQPLEMEGSSFLFMDLEGLKDKKEVLAVILLLLLYRIKREVYFGSPALRKIVLLDEAWDLLNDPMTANFMEHGYRRFRKYFSSIIIVLQGLNDLYNNPHGRTIAENSAFRFFLPQRPESIEMLQREAKLDVGEYELKLIKDLRTVPRKFSEIYIQASGFGGDIGRLIVDPFTYMLYTTKPDERAYVDKLIESGLSVRDAIKQAVGT